MGRLEIEKVLIDDTKSETFNGGKIWKDVSPCLRSSRYGHKICEIKQVAQMYGTEREPNPQAGRIYDADGISPTMDSCSGGNRMPKILDVEKVGYFPYNDGKQHQSNTVYDANGLCPTMDTMAGGNREPKIIEVQSLGNVNPSGRGQNGSVVSENGLARAVTVEKGEGMKVLSAHPILTPDRLEKRQNGRRCKEDGEPMFTITGQDRHGVLIMQIPRGNNTGGFKVICPTITKNFWEQNNYLVNADTYIVSVRKLTPLECWRLMGFTDECFRMAEEVNSNSQLYKQAGNSIVVNVLEKIIKNIGLGGTSNEETI